MSNDDIKKNLSTFIPSHHDIYLSIIIHNSGGSERTERFRYRQVATDGDRLTEI